MSGYVITGGNADLIGELAGHLRAPVLQSPQQARPDAWVHIVPSDSGVTVAEAVGMADEHLPVNEGAGFVAVVPVWGVIEPPADEPAELEAAAARALLRSRMARWAAAGRRFNIVTYGDIESANLSALRPAALLTARTPMHRRGTLTELADAIDFLCSSDASYVNGSELLLEGGWDSYSWFHPARNL